MDKLYVIDASGYLYRAYFAIRQMTNSKGESTNALFGFIRSVLKLIKDFHPTHLVSVFDGPKSVHARSKIYADYKSHRNSMPGDLLYQIQWAQQFCQFMGIPELMFPEVEADDTMGSVAVWAASKGAKVYLCTSDKDMCQFVDKHIFILNTYKDNLIIDELGVEQQFGVKPSQIIDYLSLTGDASDNIPGVPGFGPKTAAELLKTFGTLDNLLANLEKVAGKKKQELLIQEKDKALLSRQLVTIDTSVPFPKDEIFFQLKPPAVGPLKEFYSYMNFASFIREMGDISEGTKKVEKEEVVDYQLVDDEKDLKHLIHELSKYSEICLDTETTDMLPMQSSLVGIGLGVEPKKAWYIPVNGHLGLEKVLHALKPLLENPKIGFYGHNFKYDYHVLQNYGIQIAHICFDTILASYLLNSHSRQHSLDYLTLDIFGKIKIPIHDLIGKGKKQLTMDKVPCEAVCKYCCEDVDYTIRLKEVLSKQLKERGLMPLFKDLELPLIKILAKMERHGIYIDQDYLQALSKELGREIRHLEEKVYQLAGETFNLNSPKQLSQILFHKLGIKPPKKTATGHSTNADVLESLRNDYPIAEKLLEYRTLEKLRSTYVEALPKQVNPKTQRIHCNFNQFVAATGRLSCQDPNLQNIPVRTEVGRKIREAFRPEKKGWSYLAADYSQIELRLLAHLSQDPGLIEAFNQNEDIHTLTASLIFDVPLKKVAKEQRHQAKSVNFGIIYGQQAFGLSQELGIEVKTAALFIQKYFERYPKVRAYIESCKALTRQTGKSVTITGRERLIPEIHNQSAFVRAAAERLAINAPIQGTAADLIKMAMVEIDKKLAKMKKQSYMILQIHDELIFEVPDEEIDSMKHLVREAMENVFSLSVPLVVDITIGKNWKEC